MITVKEIAEQAGVSLGTVDRVLHKRGRVSQENIDLITRIAQENGYVPNQLGRRLQKNQQLRFGVLLPDMGKDHPFWGQIIDGIEEAKKELESLQIEIIYAFYSKLSEESFISAGRSLLSKGVVAYIVVPIGAFGMQQLVSLFPDIPFAFVDSDLPGFSPRWNFTQDSDSAGATGARLMDMIGEEFDRVITLPLPRHKLNTSSRRAVAFSEAYLRSHPDSKVGRIIADEIADAVDELLIMSEGARMTGLFVINSQASVLCQILDNRGVLDKFRIIGFDLSDSNKESLQAGKIFAIIGQRPRAQGHDAAMAIYNHFVLQHDSENILPAPIDIYIKENIPRSNHWL